MCGEHCRKRTLPSPSPLTAWERHDPPAYQLSHLGKLPNIYLDSTIELSLFAAVRVSWP